MAIIPVLGPLKQFLLGLSADGRISLAILLGLAALLGYVLGRRTGSEYRYSPYRVFGTRRDAVASQNAGEARVARMLARHFGPPDYHLLNHLTIPMEDGTTQVDHVLVSRFGVFVIETKDFSGWIFANGADAEWTQGRFRRKFRFQNPIRQNFRHVLAIRDLLDFLPPGAVKSAVVFCGDAEFQTPVPEGVFGMDGLLDYLRQQRLEVMTLNRLQFCVGRLETGRLALTRRTDIEHLRDLERRFGEGAR